MQDLKTLSQRFSLLLILLLFVFRIEAQQVTIIQKIEGPITLDGNVDEAAWKKLPRFDLYQQNINNGEPASEVSDVRIGYDDKFLYVAGILYDDVSKLQYPSKKRDELSLANDWFGFIIDSYDDNESGLGFFTTPAGLRLDYSVFGDAYGDFPINLSWNSFWDVKTKINTDSWSVEFKIPLSSLQFQVIDGKTEMGLILWRQIARKNEIDTWPVMINDNGFWSAFKPSNAATVQFNNLQNENPIYLTPYAIGGHRKSFQLNEAETKYVKENGLKGEIGLDLKYNINSNLTLDASINTDFAQVEADDQQVNLSRSALFFPEKRAFFQERASIFDVRGGGPNRFFYSRRIGLDQDDLPLRILGGARLTGRMGSNDVGFINMQTGPNDLKLLNKLETDSLAATEMENFTVARIRRKVINPLSTIGLIGTNRVNWNGDYNTLYGFDGRINLRKNDYLKFSVAQTLTSGEENDVLSINPMRFYVNFERFQYSGFVYDLAINYAGKDYNPSMGFESRENYLSSFGRLNYGWVPKDHAFINRHQINSFSNFYIDNDSNQSISGQLSLGYQLITNSGYSFVIRATNEYERVKESLELVDGIEIPIGFYEFPSIKIQIGSPDVHKLRYETEINIGQFYDGFKTSISVEPSINLIPGLEFGGSYHYTQIEFEERNQDLDFHIGRLKVLYMYDTKWSASSFVQLNTASDVVLWNFRLRYNHEEGTDFYLVYNEDFNTNNNAYDPILPVSNERLFLMKLTYTLKL